MDRTGLKNKVKIILDEYTPEGAGNPFDDYIGPLLDESAREILLAGPLYLLAPVAIPLTSTVYADDRSYIPLPADYLRLYEMKYPLWKRPVREAVSGESQEYTIQENEYLRAGYGRPYVALVNRTPAGGSPTKYLECGKVLASAVPDTALYVQDTAAENLAEAFVDTLSWRCAGKVLLTMGMADKAKLALEQSMAHLALITK